MVKLHASSAQIKKCTKVSATADGYWSQAQTPCLNVITGNHEGYDSGGIPAGVLTQLRGFIFVSISIVHPIGELPLHLQALDDHLWPFSASCDGQFWVDCCRSSNEIPPPPSSPVANFKQPFSAPISSTVEAVQCLELESASIPMKF